MRFGFMAGATTYDTRQHDKTNNGVCVGVDSWVGEAG